MGPRLVILDPALCLTTPAYHWLSTGVRALDHCIEALCSLEATPESDERAARGLRLLVPGLLACKADEGDAEARGRCQMAVRFAMENVRAGVPMGGSHAIGHQLGESFGRGLWLRADFVGPLGVPHGITSCIMCPAVMKFNIKHGGENAEIARRQGMVRQILWSETKIAAVLREGGLAPGSSDLGDIVDVLIRHLDLPRTLSAFDISPDKIPALAKNSLEDFWAKTNPVPLVDAAQVEEILEAVK